MSISERVGEYVVKRFYTVRRCCIIHYDEMTTMRKRRRRIGKLEVANTSGLRLQAERRDNYGFAFTNTVLRAPASRNDNRKMRERRLEFSETKETGNEMQSNKLLITKMRMGVLEASASQKEAKMNRV